MDPGSDRCASRAASLVENFAFQWLQLRRLDTAAPAPAQFATFTESLRLAMRRETELFVDAIIKEEHSILDLLESYSRVTGIY